MCALALAAEGNEMLTACLEDAQAACASCTSGSDSCEKLYEDLNKKCKEDFGLLGQPFTGHIQEFKTTIALPVVSAIGR